MFARMRLCEVLKCTKISGDVEPNPGPFWKKDEDAIENLQDIIDDQADEIKDLKETVENQSETIEELKTKIEEILVRTEEQKTESEKAAKNLADLVRSFPMESRQGSSLKEMLSESRALQVVSLEAEKETNARVFDELSAHDSRIGQELLQQKVPDTMNVDLQRSWQLKKK